VACCRRPAPPLLHPIGSEESAVRVRFLINLFKGQAVTKTYRSKDGGSLFEFAFTPQGDQIVIHCLSHPSLDGRDPNPRKTHLFASGQLCFVPGREPRDQKRAEDLARQWAEYFLE